MPDSNGVFSKAEVAYLFDTKVGTVSNWMSTGKLPREPRKQDVAHWASIRGSGVRGKGTKTYHVLGITPEQFELLQVLCVENGMEAVDPSVVQAENNAAAKAAAGRNLDNQGLDVAQLRAEIGVTIE